MRRLLIGFVCLGIMGCTEVVDATSSADAGRDSGVEPIAWASTYRTPKITADLARWALRRDGQTPEAYALPWPTDLARDSSGKVDLAYVPAADAHQLVQMYLRQFNHRLGGFSPSSTVYFRLGADVDPSTLPADAASSRAAQSSVQIVDVDPRSPERGHRFPVQWYMRAEATRYWADHTLAVAPVFGFPLRVRNRYAVVVTRDVHAMGGGAYRRDTDLDAVVSDAAPSDPVQRAAWQLHRDPLMALRDAGIGADRILTMAVFTTDDPTDEFFRIADWLRASGPAPELLDLGNPTTGTGYIRFNGHYGPNPIFQEGDNPYSVPGSGGFTFDTAGAPEVHGTENIRFALTLPTGPMPAEGWPIAVYAHGTGGSYQSFVREGVAQSLASQGVAVLGFDQIFHGERAVDGVSPENAFFNFANPAAGRTNNRQAGLDLVQCGRFVRQFAFDYVRNGTMSHARFNTNQIFFFGHSQGGLNGPLWLAAEDTARAGVLSGAGGSMALAVLGKTQPVNVPAAINGLLGLSEGELVPLHPVASLLQLLADPADPLNYGRFIVREPRPGNAPKHVFQTQGFIDHYAPPEGIAALALSIGESMYQPTVMSEAGYSLSGNPVVPLPAHGNAGTAEHPVTAAWMQFRAATGRDGHFVVFDIADARVRAAMFLGSAAHATDGVPTVPESIPMP